MAASAFERVQAGMVDVMMLAFIFACVCCLLFMLPLVLICCLLFMLKHLHELWRQKKRTKDKYEMGETFVGMTYNPSRWLWDCEHQ